jgi:hypothetical protein
MPSRFLGFLQKGRDLDMPSAAMLTAELDLTDDACMNALTHDRAARTQANRNIFLISRLTKGIVSNFDGKLQLSTMCSVITCETEELTWFIGFTNR